MSTERCFHCHEPVLTGQQFVLPFEGEPRSFCCAGCQAVADTIIQQGLADYYRFRTEPATKADAMPADLAAELASYDSPDVLADLSSIEGERSKIELSISGISCAACAWLIERRLKQLPGIASISVNSGTQRAQIEWLPEQLKLSHILQDIARLGYQASPFAADQEEKTHKAELSRYLKRLAVSGILSMQVMMLAIALYFGEWTGIDPEHQDYLRWISLLLTTPVAFYAALPFVTSAWRSIVNRKMNMDVPVSLAIYYTYFASAYATVTETGEVYFESVCMFVFFLQLGKFFEYRARAKARDATSNLLKIMPVTATQLIDGQPQSTSARRLQPGDLILVKAGETLPADGEVFDGTSSVDESMLTGEYQPIAKVAGSTVLAGSVNHDGVLQVKVGQPLALSRLGQIIALQQETLNQKPKLAEKTDELAQYFVERLLLIALATFLVWFFWIDASRAFWVTLSVLVATCPCALALATPTAITCSLAQLNRKHILIKNNQVLDRLPDIQQIVFDKTGTLTQGRFSVHQVHLLQTKQDKASLLNLIANLERHSEHPIGKAFQPYLQQELTLSKVQISIGAGISALWQGQLIQVGNAAFCRAKPIRGAMVYLTINHELQAAIELQDELRPEVPALLQTLKAKGYQLGLLTGDSSSQAERVAQQLGFDWLEKGCSPEQKVTVIQQLTAQQQKVMMIGDGINDSACFHAADVSVTLQGSTDLAKNQADVLILRNDLSLLTTLLAGAEQTARTIKQNLAWSVGYNVIIIPLAVVGLVSPYIAVLGMSFSSLLVVSNSLRLLKS
ncbi:heavy metal translocating P-type ATPase [Alkalimonas mucilaginosa]|uniref:Heavy metal translocating P-type ATPase n=1 Tax=Alkalimonas mucilaginosa TaxID=3057676 RepID=A0ABU7JDG7_9GAMM|nr:heavy metal translocating P-type ATPase [Alkalimonas sp. MEB004]MEE2023744.1 heavy metal translocating P-type ATPase [Alkalimonas sp. MEB004]